MLWLFKKNPRLIREFLVPVLTAFITWSLGYYFWQNTCNNQKISDVENNWIISNTVKWNVIQNNIKQPTPLEIENEKIWQDDRGKVSGFFRYWNEKEYDKARNNIGPDISYKFTNDSMSDFYKNMTDFFEIQQDEQRWEISNSEFFASTKHNIELFYWYSWKEYIDKILIVVTRRKEDLKQHHITQIKCEWVSWPFCKMFGY